MRLTYRGMLQLAITLGVVLSVLLHSAQSATGPAPEVTAIVPHASIIGSMAFSADGRRLVSGDWNGFVKVWDVGTRQLLRTYEKNLYAINAVAFSPSGNEVAIGGKDYWSFKLVDAPSGRTIRKFEGHQGEIHAIAFSPDGSLLAAGDGHGLAKLWDVASGRLVRDLSGHGQAVRAVAFTPDGRQVLTAGFDTSVIVWDVATGDIARHLTGSPVWRMAQKLTGSGPQRHEDVFISLAISPDGKWLASGSWGSIRNVKLWDLGQGKLVRVLEGMSDSVQAVAFTRDSRHVVAASSYSKLIQWDASSGAVVRTIGTERGGTLYAMAVSPKGNLIVSGSGERGNGPTLWNADTGAKIGGLGTDLRKGIFLALTPDGSRLAAGADNGAAVWDIASGRLINDFGDHNGEVSGIAISDDGRSALTGGRDKVLKLWDVASGKLLRTLEGHANWVERVVFARDGLHAASGSFIDGVIKVWNLNAGKDVLTLRRHRSSIASLAFSPDGRLLLSGSWDGSVILWDLADGRVRLDLKSEIRGQYNPKKGDMDQASRAMSWVGFSRDGTRVLAVTHNGAFSAWDAGSGALLAQRPASSGYLPYFIGLHDGALLASDPSTGVIELTDVASGKVARVLPGLDRGTGGSLAASADHRRLASMGNDGVIRLWDTETGMLLASLFNGNNNEWLSLTPQGFFNASSTRAGALLSVIRGLESTSIAQMWQSLFAPDLLREQLAADPDGEVRRAATATSLMSVVDSGPAPIVGITSPSDGSRAERDLVTVGAHIKDSGKGVGRIEWRVNGVTATVSAVPPGKGAYDVEQELALDPGENVVSVVAYNGRNVLASLAAETRIVRTATADARKSDLHVLAIGINGYSDRGWTPPGSVKTELFPPLALAVEDARAFTEALARAATGLYGNVKLHHALDADATPAGLERIVKEIAVEVSPRDTFVLFVAAHGYSIDGRFYLIPFDYQGGTDPDALRSRAIGQERLQDWIANRIRARRAVVLLDTCESGALTNGYLHSRTDGPASEAAVGRLHEATGRPVLTAAAAGKPAFEGYEGHGVFTWALIDALRNGDRNGNGEIEVSELVAHVQDQVPRIAAKLNGSGRAAVAARGSTEDRQTARFGSRGDDFTLARRLP